jgi:hypothetical protein
MSTVRVRRLYQGVKKQITVTGTSTLLFGETSLYGAIVPPNTVSIGIVPEDGTKGVRVNLAGAAIAMTSAMLEKPGVWQMDLTSAQMVAMQLIRDSAEGADVPCTLTCWYEAGPKGA